MATKTLGQLAEYVGGKVAGSKNIKINSAATIENAAAGDITFLTNHKYTNQLKTTKASAVVVSKEVKCPAALLITDDPYYAFRQIVVLLHGHRRHPDAGISPEASIAKTSKLGKNCRVYNFVTISENVQIGNRCILYPGAFIGPETQVGDDCIFYPNAVIYEKCKIANRVTIHANATIGQDGFGFATHKGRHHKIPHIGSVIIEDDVEIGSGCAIERGTLDNTVVGKGSKIGDLVVIGHGTKIGPHCLLVAQVGIAGSAALGRRCVIGGQSGIVGHINIGNGVKIGAQAGVINDVPDGAAIFGSPAIDAVKAKRAYSLIEYLPDMRKNIHKLEKQLLGKKKKQENK